jgi:hypothetical protein
VTINGGGKMEATIKAAEYLQCTSTSYTNTTSTSYTNTTSTSYTNPIA